MRTTVLMGALLVVGCGGAETSFKVSGNTLTVRDVGYFYSEGHDYCQGGGAGQLMLDFVDYNYICDPKNPPQRDANAPHSELRVILTIGIAPDFNANGAYPTMKPYDAMQADCVFAGAPVVAQFIHYGGGGVTTPDMQLVAGSGNVTITQFDPAKMKPLKGSFDLHFGAEDVKNSFTIYACN